MSVEVKGLSEVQKLLDGYKPKILDKRMQKALMIGARALVKPIRAEAPHRTGLLAKVISARQGKKDRPSAVVGPRAGKRGAFYRHMVIRGTKPHRIRFADQKAAGVPKDQGNIRHPGARANPFVDRGVAAGIDNAIREYKKALFKEDK